MAYGRDARQPTRIVRQQIIPFLLPANAPLHIDLFIDRSVIEIFVNSRFCIVQRVYPTRLDSSQCKPFTHDYLTQVTNPW